MSQIPTSSDMDVCNNKREEEEEEEEETDRWSNLPSDILQLIFNNHLSPNFEDFIRFQIVCTSWFYATASGVPRSLPSTRIPPLLMIGPASGSGFQWYDLPAAARPVALTTPTEITNQGWRFCGTSHGWLTIMSPTEPAQMRLYNPISGACIRLPTLQHDTSAQLALFGRSYQSPNYKAALSSPPWSGNCKVAVINRSRNMMAACNVGDDDWSECTVWQLVKLVDLTFSKGDGRLFILGWTACGLLGVCSISPQHAVMETTIVVPWPPKGPYSYHLIAGGRGRELLCVLAPNLYRQFWLGREHWCNVYKLEGNRLQWCDLGGQTLLLGSTGSECLFGKNLMDRGLRTNCIYYRGVRDELLVFDTKELKLEYVRLPPPYLPDIQLNWYLPGL